MNIQCIYDEIAQLPKEEKLKLFQMLKRPMPQIDSKWIHGWKGLSIHFGGPSIRTLQRLHKEGLFKKHKLGKTVLFDRHEMDKAPVEV